MLLTATGADCTNERKPYGVAVAVIIWESEGVLCPQFPVRNKKTGLPGERLLHRETPSSSAEALPSPPPSPFQSLNWTQLGTGGRGRRGGREDSVLRRRLGRRLGVLFFGKIREVYRAEGRSWEWFFFGISLTAAELDLLLPSPLRINRTINWGTKTAVKTGRRWW